MDDRSAMSQKIQEHDQNVWQAGDPWGFEEAAFEQARDDWQLEVLSDRRGGSRSPSPLAALFRAFDPPEGVDGAAADESEAVNEWRPRILEG
jgi:hypothetical protein